MIYTFYSFKGGVGRSMAMAAVAYVFAQRGLRVLAIDFDLEAPGLERYFFEPDHAQQVRAQPGLVDLLQTYKLALTSEAEFREARFRKWWNFAQEAIPSTAGSGCVDLMTAGQREPEAKLREYAATVRSFDWLDFFHNWKGDQFFDWLRKQLLTGVEDGTPPYDVVLVDSRTGVTEMGGVCAYQLADCAVMLCAANYQNIDGTLAVARDFQSEAVRALRRGRPLELLVLPARLEENNDQREKFLSKFEATFERSQYLPRVLYEAGLDYRALAQPYDPEFAVIERLVGDSEAANAKSSRKAVRSFGRLADALTLLASTSGKLQQQQASVMARLQGGEAAPAPTEQIADPTHRTSGFDVFIDYSRGDESVASLVSERLRHAGLNVWRDTEELRTGSRWSEQLNQVLGASEVLVVIIGMVAPSSHLGRTIAFAQQRGRPRIVPVVVMQEAGAHSGWRSEILAGLGLLDTQILTIDPEVRDERSLAQLIQAVRARPRAEAPVQAQTTASIQRSPYPGERPLAEDDAPFFFGRERELRDLLKFAASVKVTVLTGAAGIGKTSLLCAGMIPSLRRAAEGMDVHYINCGDFDADAALEDLQKLLLSRHGWPSWIIIDGIDTFLHDGERAAVTRRVDAISGILRDAHGDTKFMLALRDVLDPDMRAYAMDRWGLVRDPSSAAFVSLKPMDAEAMQAAIERPAAQLGHVIEPGLTKLLIDNAGSPHSAIAQVARVLPRLWEERRRGWITTRTYEAMAGVQGSFERAVSTFVGNLTEPQQKAFETLVETLSVFDTTLQLSAEPGRWWQIATIPRIGAAGAIALRDRLASAHLIDLWRAQTSSVPLTTDLRNNLETEVTVALLYSTPRHYGHSFSEALDPAFLLWRRSFGSYVRTWELSQRSESAVVCGAPLAEADAFVAKHEDELSEPERTLVRESWAAKSRQESVRTKEEERVQRKKQQLFRARVAVVVLIVALGFMYWSTQMRLQAERETARAEQVAQDLRRAHAAEEQRRRALERAIDAIAKDLEVLRNVVGTASADTQLKQSVDQAENSIAQQVRSLTTSITRVAPRVYIHIVDESQRTAAEAFERRIETMRIGSVAIVVPGIQKVGSGPPFSQLRCFAPTECQQNGPRLLQIINAELSEPTIRLQDFSSFGQSGDGKFRADHYELWFAPGPISLRQSGSMHSGTSG